MDGMRDQVFGDFRRHAVDEIEHARRHARVMEAAHEADGRARRFLGALEDDRAAGGERRRDLAHGLGDREIPRREAGDDADRLQDHHVAHAVGAGRDDAAVGAFAFLGEPVDDVGAAQHFGLGLGEDLALLQRQHGGDGVGALAQEVGGLAQDLAAVEGGGLAPDLEALLGGGDGLVEVAFRGVAELAEGGVLGRIHDVLRFGAGGLDPLAVDVMVERFVHAKSSGLMSGAVPCRIYGRRGGLRQAGWCSGVDSHSALRCVPGLGAPSGARRSGAFTRQKETPGAPQRTITTGKVPARRVSRRRREPAASGKARGEIITVLETVTGAVDLVRGSREGEAACMALSLLRVRTGRGGSWGYSQATSAFWRASKAAMSFS